jgi:membrane dipeptidase
MRETPKIDQGDRERALEIHRKSIVIDGLSNLNESLKPFPKEHLINVRDCGLTAVNDSVPLLHVGFRETVDKFVDLHRLVQQFPDVIDVALSAEDIESAKKAQKWCLICGFQSSDPIEGDIGPLTVFHRLGLRIFGLNYNERDFIGDGCTERTDSGLSRFGMDVVEELNRLGITIDLSHSGDRTRMDTLELTKDPVVFSHANARSVCDSPRNVTDEQLKALAEKDGVIGLCVFGPLVKTTVGKERPTMEDFVKQVDYVCNLIGIDHVGLSTDLGFGYFSPPYKYYRELGELVARAHSAVYRGTKEEEAYILEKITDWPQLTVGLVSGGYSDQEVQKILGGNFMRVFKKVWRPRPLPPKREFHEFHSSRMKYLIDRYPHP